VVVVVAGARPVSAGVPAGPPPVAPPPGAPPPGLPAALHGRKQLLPLQQLRPVLQRHAALRGPAPHIGGGAPPRLTEDTPLQGLLVTNDLQEEELTLQMLPRFIKDHERSQRICKYTTRGTTGPRLHLREEDLGPEDGAMR